MLGKSVNFFIQVLFCSDVKIDGDGALIFRRARWQGRGIADTVQRGLHRMIDGGIA